MTDRTITSAQQHGTKTHWHTIRQSPMFVIFPAVAMVLLLVNFTWETLRANGVVSEHSFTLVDVPTTVNMIGLLAGLMLARAQFARTVRPNFGYSWTKSDAADPASWKLHFYNAGPGHASITSIAYRLSSLDGCVRTDSWLEYPALMDEVESLGITSETDIPWIGRAPLAPQARSTEGYRIGTFEYSALVRLSQFEVRITSEDVVGDRHTLHIDAFARLPRKAIKAITEQRGT